MAPFSEALAVKFNRRLEDGTRVYSAVLDPKWTVARLGVMVLVIQSAELTCLSVHTQVYLMEVHRLHKGSFDVAELTCHCRLSPRGYLGSSNPGSSENEPARSYTLNIAFLPADATR